MTPNAPELDAGLLERYLDQLATRRRDQGEGAIPTLALRAGGWKGPAELTIAGLTVQVRWCSSGLAVRAALLEARAHPSLVVLTPLGAGELGLDVLARLYRHRIEDIDRWDTLMAAFGATRLDRRLEGLGWLADELLAASGPRKFPAVPTGTLDLATAWYTFLSHRLGLDACHLQAVLTWLESGSGPTQLRTLSGAAQGEVVEYVRTVGGHAAGIAMGLAARGDELRALPLGLVLRVIASDAEPARRDAAIRLEALLGGEALPPEHAAAWATAAEDLLAKLDRSPRGETALGAADALLAQLRADAWAAESDVLQAGLRRRLESFAGGLREGLGSIPAAPPGDLEEAAERLIRHRRLPRESAGGPRAAVRLLRWLAEVERRPTPQTSFVTAVERYTSHEGWVDWARTELSRWLSELDEPLLAEAVRSVLSRVAAVRETQNQRFGELLPAWFAGGSAPPWLVPIEQVLDRVVAPLARERPVLLVVVDGASVAVLRELQVSLEASGWSVRVPLTEAAERRELWGLAALPTITAVCRTSLLSGSPRRGSQHDEKRAFASHPALRGVSSRSHPVLFHKAELRSPADGGLAIAVRDEVAGSGRRIVGVVINAVDDDLDQDQTRVRWQASNVGPLVPLLEAAREGGRLVVLTSDHGHVHEWGLDLQGHRESGDRWRPAAGSAPAPGEVVVAGPRVLAENDGGAVIVPWSETLRYGRRKAGYHGGASPQELIVPLQILAPLDLELDRWQELAPAPPPWWLGPTFAAEPAREAQRIERASATKRSPQQPSLFEASTSPMPHRTTVDRLFSSDVFADQLDRYAPSAELQTKIRRALEALELAGWRAANDQLAAATGTSPLRLAGLIGEAQKLLNIEGYMVLDRRDGTVAVDRPLLVQLFALDEKR